MEHTPATATHPTTSHTTTTGHSNVRRRRSAMVGALTLASLLGGVVASTQTAAAAPVQQTETAPWVGLGFTPAAGAAIDQSGNRMVITGSIQLDIIGTPIVVDHGQITLQRNAATGRWEVVGGYAQVPIPKIGPLAGAEVRQAPFAQFGRASGRDLAGLDAHLLDDATYWYFEFDGGLDIGLPFAADPLLSALPGSIKIGGGTGLVVVEEHGTYAYVGGDCPALPNGKQVKRAVQRTAAQRAGLDARAEQRSRKAAVQDLRDLVQDELAGVELSLRPSDLSRPECGLGFSSDGSIPARDLQGNVFHGSVVVDGVFNVNPFIEVNGTATLQADRSGVTFVANGDIAATLPLTDLSMPLGDAAVQIRVDGTGARVTGTAALAIPQVAVDGRATVDLKVDTKTPANSTFHADAAVSVAGSRLADASIDMSRQGLIVAGKAKIGTTEVGLRGEVSSKGANLTGTTSVTFPSNILDSLAQNNAAAIKAAERDVASLDSQIAAMRTTVRNELAATSTTLRNRARAVANERAKLDAIGATIAKNNDSIRYYRNAITNENNWYNRLNVFDRIAKGPAHLARLTSYNASIVGLDAANVTQQGYQTVAKAALTGAEQLVASVRNDLAKANVDDDVRIVALKTRRNVSDTNLQALRTKGSKVQNGAQLKGTVTATVGTGGLSATIDVQLCNTGGCQTLAGASLQLGAHPQACVDVLGLGKVCAAI